MSFRLAWAIALVIALAAIAVVLDTPATAESTGSPALSNRGDKWVENGDSTAYIGELIFAAAQARIDEDAAVAEALRQIALQQAASAQVPKRQAPASFDYPAECSGHPVPAYILWRESHCNYGSVNSTGCGGYGCVGMYQFDYRHWIGSGGCAWLGDWTVPANQDACADQMSRGGTSLSAWGG